MVVRVGKQQTRGEDMTRTSEPYFLRILRDFYFLLHFINSGFNDPFTHRFKDKAPELLAELEKRLVDYIGSYRDNVEQRRVLKNAIDELKRAFEEQDMTRMTRVVLAFTRNATIRIQSNNAFIREFILLLNHLNFVGFTSKTPPTEVIQRYLDELVQARASSPDDKLLESILEAIYSEMLELAKRDVRDFWIFVSALNRNFEVTISV